MAARGDDPLRIKQRAAHSSFSTTEGSLREAENRRAGFGDPFPPLPADLLETVERDVRPAGEPTPKAVAPETSRETSGVKGDRTPDLIHAMDALSQLSYDPDFSRSILRRASSVPNFFA